MLPIACVDVVPIAPGGAVLLVRRVNEPAAGEWWFPGGRVHHGETRAEAAERKLLEESGLRGVDFTEAGTYDVIFSGSAGPGADHGITTIFRAWIPAPQPPRIDDQSFDAQWRTPADWLREPLMPFVLDRMAELA